VDLSTDANFTTVTQTANINDYNILSWELGTDLSANTKYYWRVRSYNTDNEYSAWSLVRYFRTAIAPPTLLSPENLSSTTSHRPVFDWENVTGASSYTIQASTSPVFATVLATSTVVSSTYTPLVDLPHAAIYWRVRANGLNGPSAWSSPIWTFTVTPP
jgi:hypothetical protein